MAHLEDFFLGEEKKLNPNPMNAPSTPPSCIPQMRCGERGSRTIWTTTTKVLLSLGTSSSSSSFRTLHGLLQRSRKGRKGKEGRKRARRRRRRLSNSSACVSVCAQFGRHLETRSQVYIFSLIYIYIYSQKGYLLCKLKVLKPSAFSDFLSQKKSPKNISPKKIKIKSLTPRKAPGPCKFFITGLGPGVYFKVNLYWFGTWYIF
jgi:hypothetical protein